MDRSGLRDLLAVIYGRRDVSELAACLEALVGARSGHAPRSRHRRLSAADAILITYPDQVQTPGQAPLQTLYEFAERYIANLASHIHILPFFPSSSDDGFAVVDYDAVYPAFGGWIDIARFRPKFRLMFDAVVNHVSVQNQWFQAFLRGEPEYADFFIEVPDSANLTSVVRPRTTPLLTQFPVRGEKRSVWTTFSSDQVDLNYSNPDVLLHVIEVLLRLADKGGSILRLDAIAYIWKEIGTSSIHMPQTHAIVRLMRAVLREAAPDVLILTETNVGQEENLEYLGNGDEAHLVYSFALPVLILQAFQKGQTTRLAEWASSTAVARHGTDLVNILATHDGIGLNGCRGLLSSAELEALVLRAEAAGGHISRRSRSDGGSDPYEINMNYMDALDACGGGGGDDLSIARFIAAHAIMLAIKGTPAIYFHSLFGSKGWPEGARLTGRKRTINREKCELMNLQRELADQSSRRSRIYSALARLLRTRQQQSCFDPDAPQESILATGPIFGILRGDRRDHRQALCLQNLTANPVWCPCEVWQAGWVQENAVDLVSRQAYDWHRGGRFRLGPYGVYWLTIH